MHDYMVECDSYNAHIAQNFYPCAHGLFKAFDMDYNASRPAPRIAFGHGRVHMQKVSNVAVFLPIENTYDREVLKGVIDWADVSSRVRLHRWSTLGSISRGSVSAAHLTEKLAHYRIDGILTDIHGTETLEWLQNLGIPVVDVGGTWPASQAAGVHVDNSAVGRMGARHLLEKGIKHFAFCGRAVPLSARQRRDAFVDELAKAGFSCDVLETNIDGCTWPEESEMRGSLVRWLTSLPKPVGIMCWYDVCGLDVQRSCRDTGIALPDDVALVTVEHDEFAFQQGNLSTVQVGARNIGYQAVKLLDRMMRTGYRPRRHLLLPPGNLVARRSSDIAAVGNPQVARAITFILNNADKLISVQDVLRVVPIGRRTMEMQFMALFGRTPRRQIQYVHVERAKSLLGQYNLSIAGIARLSGFPTRPAFDRVFKRTAGCTPGEYRRRLLRPEII